MGIDSAAVFASAAAAAGAHRHRRVVAVGGPAGWGAAEAWAALVGVGWERGAVWVAEGAVPPGVLKTLHVRPSHLRRLLGSGLRCLVLNLHDTGLDPDLLGIAEGMVVGGGVLVLLCPSQADLEAGSGVAEASLAVWPYTPADVSAHFPRRFARALRRSGAAVVLAPPRAMATPAPAVISDTPTNPADPSTLPAIDAHLERGTHALTVLHALAQSLAQAPCSDASRLVVASGVDSLPPGPMMDALKLAVARHLTPETHVLLLQPPSGGPATSSGALGVLLPPLDGTEWHADVLDASPDHPIPSRWRHAASGATLACWPAPALLPPTLRAALAAWLRRPGRTAHVYDAAELVTGAAYSPWRTAFAVEVEAGLLSVASSEVLMSFEEGTSPGPQVTSSDASVLWSHMERRAAQLCRTADQAAAVLGILECALRPAAPRRRKTSPAGPAAAVAVLVADRGYGKTTSLAIAARLLQAVWLGVRLCLTGPSAPSTTEVSPDLAYRSPLDVIERAAGPIDVLLVDEAAGLPVDVLKALVASAMRCAAFATTVHGYEGCGRGFAVRFQQFLREAVPGWRSLRLAEPVRWAAGDPVQAWCCDCLLLDAEAPGPAKAEAALRFAAVARETLAGDEALLRGLFGLLVLAHYHTSPGDLRRLLDAPNIRIFALLAGDAPTAVAMVAEEGGLEADTVDALVRGRHRLRGHMLPEVLACHAGRPAAARLRAWRVVRIAVHPAVQRRGLGGQLLRGIEAAAREAASPVQWLGSGFGAAPEVVHFWRSHGYRLVHVGGRRGAESGVPSAVVARPLCPAAEAVVAAAAADCRRALPFLLGDPLADLDVPAACSLLRLAATAESCPVGSGLADETPASGGSPSSPPGGLGLALAPQEWYDLCGFAYGHRPYDSAVRVIWQFVTAILGHYDRLATVVDQPDLQLMILKVVQRRPWPAVVAALAIDGPANGLRALRRALRRTLPVFGPTDLPTLAAAFDLRGTADLGPDGGPAPSGPGAEPGDPG